LGALGPLGAFGPFGTPAPVSGEDVGPALPPHATRSAPATTIVANAPHAPRRTFRQLMAAPP